MQNRIREIRRDLSLSQEKLAERVGTSKAQISKLETSQRRLTDFWLFRLADALECAPWEILINENNHPPFAVNNREQKLLDAFRSLDENRKNAVLLLIDNS